MPRDVVSPAPNDRPAVHEKVRLRKRKRRRGLPAHLVFYLTALPAAVTAGLTYFGGPTFLPFSVAACLLLAWVLFVNDRKGFIKSKSLRRAFSPRRHFSEGEQVILIALLMLNAFAGAQAIFW